MRRLTIRLLVILTAFVIGISAAWYNGILTKAEMLLAKVAPDLIFHPSGRGCGCGWWQDYNLLDGRLVTESSIVFCQKTEDRPKSQLAQENFQSLIAGASKIVKRIPEYNSFYQREGERIELIYFEESGEQRAKVLWYDSNTTLSEIDAPTLEIAVGFEASNASIH